MRESQRYLTSSEKGKIKHVLEVPFPVLQIDREPIPFTYLHLMPNFWMSKENEIFPNWNENEPMKRFGHGKSNQQFKGVASVVSHRDKEDSAI